MCTHIINTLISDLVGVVKSCGLRGEGRRDLDEGFKVWSKDKSYYYIGSREFSFFLHILYL